MTQFQKLKLYFSCFPFIIFYVISVYKPHLIVLWFACLIWTTQWIYSVTFWTELTSWVSLKSNCSLISPRGKSWSFTHKVDLEFFDIVIFGQENEEERLRDYRVNARWRDDAREFIPHHNNTNWKILSDSVLNIRNGNEESHWKFPKL